MRSLFLIALLSATINSHAGDNGLTTKPLNLDLKPDFNAELKQQDKKVFDTPRASIEEKSIFDKTERPKHQFTFGVAAGGTMSQEGVKPLAEKPLKPKMTTVFEK